MPFLIKLVRKQPQRKKSGRAFVNVLEKYKRKTACTLLWSFFSIEQTDEFISIKTIKLN